ncbi:serine/threonine-protein phosphatase [Candidatus Woesearchaeota archaeon]|nr:serine/threonine-protein phosphatase [Candidatus Woesearchaeota archaeon]
MKTSAERFTERTQTFEPERQSRLLKAVLEFARTGDARTGINIIEIEAAITLTGEDLKQLLAMPSSQIDSIWAQIYRALSADRQGQYQDIDIAARKNLADHSSALRRGEFAENPLADIFSPILNFAYLTGQGYPVTSADASALFGAAQAAAQKNDALLKENADRLAAEDVTRISGITEASAAEQAEDVTAAQTEAIAAREALDKARRELEELPAIEEAPAAPTVAAPAMAAEIAARRAAKIAAARKIAPGTLAPVTAVSIDDLVTQISTLASEFDFSGPEDKLIEFLKEQARVMASYDRELTGEEIQRIFTESVKGLKKRANELRDQAERENNVDLLALLDKLMTLPDEPKFDEFRYRDVTNRIRDLPEALDELEQKAPGYQIFGFMRDAGVMLTGALISNPERNVNAMTVTRETLGDSYSKITDMIEIAQGIIEEEFEPSMRRLLEQEVANARREKRALSPELTSRIIDAMTSMTAMYESKNRDGSKRSGSVLLPYDEDMYGKKTSKDVQKMIDKMIETGAVPSAFATGMARVEVFNNYDRFKSVTAALFREKMQTDPEFKKAMDTFYENYIRNKLIEGDVIDEQGRPIIGKAVFVDTCCKSIPLLLEILVNEKNPVVETKSYFWASDFTDKNVIYSKADRGAMKRIENLMIYSTTDPESLIDKPNFMAQFYKEKYIDNMYVLFGLQRDILMRKEATQTAPEVLVAAEIADFETRTDNIITRVSRKVRLPSIANELSKLEIQSFSLLYRLMDNMGKPGFPEMVVRFQIVKDKLRAARYAYSSGTAYEFKETPYKLDQTTAEEFAIALENRLVLRTEVFQIIYEYLSGEKFDPETTMAFAVKEALDVEERLELLTRLENKLTEMGVDKKIRDREIAEALNKLAEVGTRVHRDDVITKEDALYWDYHETLHTVWDNLNAEQQAEFQRTLEDVKLELPDALKNMPEVKELLDNTEEFFVVLATTDRLPLTSTGPEQDKLISQIIMNSPSLMAIFNTDTYRLFTGMAKAVLNKEVTVKELMQQRRPDLFEKIEKAKTPEVAAISDLQDVISREVARGEQPIAKFDLKKSVAKMFKDTNNLDSAMANSLLGAVFRLYTTPEQVDQMIEETEWPGVAAEKVKNVKARLRRYADYINTLRDEAATNELLETERQLPEAQRTFTQFYNTYYDNYASEIILVRAVDYADKTLTDLFKDIDRLTEVIAQENRDIVELERGLQAAEQRTSLLIALSRIDWFTDTEKSEFQREIVMLQGFISESEKEIAKKTSELAQLRKELDSRTKNRLNVARIVLRDVRDIAQENKDALRKSPVVNRRLNNLVKQYTYRNFLLGLTDIERKVIKSLAVEPDIGDQILKQPTETFNMVDQALVDDFITYLAKIGYEFTLSYNVPSDIVLKGENFEAVSSLESKLSKLPELGIKGSAATLTAKLQANTKTLVDAEYLASSDINELSNFISRLVKDNEIIPLTGRLGYDDNSLLNTVYLDQNNNILSNFDLNAQLVTFLGADNWRRIPTIINDQTLLDWKKLRQEGKDKEAEDLIKNSLVAEFLNTYRYKKASETALPLSVFKEVGRVIAKEKQKIRDLARILAEDPDSPLSLEEASEKGINIKKIQAAKRLRRGISDRLIRELQLAEVRAELVKTVDEQKKQHPRASAEDLARLTILSAVFEKDLPLESVNSEIAKLTAQELPAEASSIIKEQDLVRLISTLTDELAVGVLLGDELNIPPEKRLFTKLYQDIQTKPAFMGFDGKIDFYRKVNEFNERAEEYKKFTDESLRLFEQGQLMQDILLLRAEAEYGGYLAEVHNLNNNLELILEDIRADSKQRLSTLFRVLLEQPKTAARSQEIIRNYYLPQIKDPQLVLMRDELASIEKRIAGLKGEGDSQDELEEALEEQSELINDMKDHKESLDFAEKVREQLIDFIKKDGLSIEKLLEQEAYSQSDLEETAVQVGDRISIETHNSQLNNYELVNDLGQEIWGKLGGDSNRMKIYRNKEGKPEKVLIEVGDARGTGYEAAIIKRLKQQVFDYLEEFYPGFKELSLGGRLTLVNRIFTQVTEGKFAEETAQYVEIDLVTNNIEYSTVGRPIFVLKADGTVRRLQPVEKIGSMVMGQYKEGFQFGTGAASLEMGDRLILFSEGMSEGLEEKIRNAADLDSIIDFKEKILEQLPEQRNDQAMTIVDILEPELVKAPTFKPVDKALLDELKRYAEIVDRSGDPAELHKAYVEVSKLLEPYAELSREEIRMLVEIKRTAILKLYKDSVDPEMFPSTDYLLDLYYDPTSRESKLTSLRNGAKVAEELVKTHPDAVYIGLPRDADIMLRFLLELHPEKADNVDSMLISRPSMGGLALYNTVFKDFLKEIEKHVKDTTGKDPTKTKEGYDLFIKELKTRIMEDVEDFEAGLLLEDTPKYKRAQILKDLWEGMLKPKLESSGAIAKGKVVFVDTCCYTYPPYLEALTQYYAEREGINIEAKSYFWTGQFAPATGVTSVAGSVDSHENMEDSFVNALVVGRDSYVKDVFVNPQLKIHDNPTVVLISFITDLIVHNLAKKQQRQILIRSKISDLEREITNVETDFQMIMDMPIEAQQKLVNDLEGMQRQLTALKGLYPDIMEGAVLSKIEALERSIANRRDELEERMLFDIPETGVDDAEKATPLTPEVTPRKTPIKDVSKVTPEQAAQGEMAKQYNLDEIAADGQPVWAIAGGFDYSGIGTHPLQTLENRLTGEKILLKSGPMHTNVGEFLSQRFNKLVGNPVADETLVRYKGEIRQAIGFLEGFKSFDSGPKEAESFFINGKEIDLSKEAYAKIQRSFLMDLLTFNYDRTAWNMMYNEETGEIVLIDHGASFISRAQGGFKGFPDSMDIAQIEHVLTSPQWGGIINKAYDDMIAVIDGEVIVKDKKFLGESLDMLAQVSDAQIDAIIEDSFKQIPIEEQRAILEKGLRSVEYKKDYKSELAKQTLNKILDEYDGDMAAYFKEAMKKRLDQMLTVFSGLLGREAPSRLAPAEIKPVEVLKTVEVSELEEILKEEQVKKKATDIFARNKIDMTSPNVKELYDFLESKGKRAERSTTIENNIARLVALNEFIDRQIKEGKMPTTDLVDAGESAFFNGNYIADIIASTYNKRVKHLELSTDYLFFNMNDKNKFIPG